MEKITYNTNAGIKCLLCDIQTNFTLLLVGKCSAYFSSARYNNLGLNHAEVYCFYSIKLFEKNEKISKKSARIVHSKLFHIPASSHLLLLNYQMI